MNAYATLTDGTVVSELINDPQRGVDTVYLDDWEETSVSAEVTTDGYVTVTRARQTLSPNPVVLGQYQVLGDTNGDWFVYEQKTSRLGPEDRRLVVRGPDRLRTLGALLATF